MNATAPGTVDVMHDVSHGICVVEARSRVMLSESHARRIARNMRNRQHESRGQGPIHHYHCGTCGWWHVGHSYLSQNRKPVRPPGTRRRPRRRRRTMIEPRPVSDINDIFPPESLTS